MIKIYNKIYSNVRSTWLSFKTSGSFTQNAIITIIGRILSVFVVIVSSPIITRIYSPDDYGNFALINLIVLQLAMILGGRYPMALVLPKNKSQFYNLLQVIVLFSLSFAIFFQLILWLTGDFLISLIGGEDIIAWKFYLVPFALLTLGLEVLSQWGVREKLFTKLSIYNIFSNIGGKAATIGYGKLISPSFLGLILGDLILRFTNSIVLIVLLTKNVSYKVVLKFNFKRIWITAKNYQKYPFFMLPSGWISLVSNQLPIIFLGSYFGNIQVGFYALASSILDLPSRVFINSLIPVFLQKANEESNISFNSLSNFSYRFFKRLLYLSSIPMGIIYFSGEFLFGIVFGEIWSTAGVFASFLIFNFLLSLVVDPLSIIFNVLGKEQYKFFMNLSMILIRAVSLFFSVNYLENPSTVILCYSVCSALVYFIFLIITFKVLKFRIFKILQDTLLGVFVGFICGWFFNIIIQNFYFFVIKWTYQ